MFVGFFVEYGERIRPRKEGLDVLFAGKAAGITAESADVCRVLERGYGSRSTRVRPKEERIRLKDEEFDSKKEELD